MDILQKIFTFVFSCKLQEAESITILETEKLRL